LQFFAPYGAKLTLFHESIDFLSNKKKKNQNGVSKFEVLKKHKYKKVLRLNSPLVALLDRFAPLRTYNRRGANSLTWFDDAVLSAIQDRNRAYSSSM
jgi:cytochrome oxidase Cu insertion factor (SCO1/SenC/PrrC family)